MLTLTLALEVKKMSRACWKRRRDRSPPPARAALSAWADQTRELLQWIDQQGDAVSESRTPKQVMALGSFRTHLVMGLKALRYAES